MRGYLLDTNHVSAHFEEKPGFMQRLRLTPVDTQWRVCAITLGEIEASHEMSVSTNLPRRNRYAAFVIDNYGYHALDITGSTRIYYAAIISRIWLKHRPGSKKIKTERHLLEHGVDINDVWMISSAWEHGLIALTADAMACIREVVPEVQFECWI